MHSTTTKSQRGGGVIERYREFLPVSPATPIISLGEGNTPLIYSPRLSERVGRGCEVFVKNEGVNPTGSFKDRGMTVAVSKAMECGTTALICASTGNTSASAAAYAARAGISCVVILPAGKIATGKLLQAFVYGAKIVAIDGNFDDALRIVRELGETDDFTIVNSINPDRIAGQKTAAFEIVDELGDAPDFHLLPVGNAGNITAYWAGYREYLAHERSTRLPAMLGFQAIGAAPIFYDRIIDKPETIASAIRIGNPASWQQARAAIVESRRRDRCSQRSGHFVCADVAGTEGRNFCRAGQRGVDRRFFQVLRFSRCRALVPKNSGSQPNRLHRHWTRPERPRCHYRTNERIEADRRHRSGCATRN